MAGQVLDMVSFVLGQLLCSSWQPFLQEGRMLPHTGLFLLWKVALQIRIRRILKHERTKTPASLYTTKTFGRPTHKGRKALPPWHAATKSAVSPSTAHLRPKGVSNNIVRIAETLHCLSLPCSTVTRSVQRTKTPTLFRNWTFFLVWPSYSPSIP